MAETVKVAVSDSDDKPDATAKRGDTVENLILIQTGSYVVRPEHDEQAREEFEALYKGKKLDHVECIAKTHTIGHGIEYTFRADVK